MTLFERINDLSKQRGVSISKLAEDIGLSSQSIYKWKTNMPSADKLQKAADYFDVSTDYLLGREEVEPSKETDLSKMLDNAMSFDGKPMSDHDREVILAYLEGKFGSK